MCYIEIMGKKSIMPSSYLVFSWADIYNLTLQLSERIVKSGYKPDIIVGIARGGWIPARILTDVLYARTLENIRIEYYFADEIGTRGKEPQITQPITGTLEKKRILLVDEVADSGETLTEAIKHVEELGAKEVRTAILHMKPSCKIQIDYWVHQVNAWTIYPWEHRESIIAIVKKFKSEDPNLDEREIRDKLVFEVGFEPTIADYFMQRL
jgi:hypoxanthine phosphoribosyltransferase